MRRGIPITVYKIPAIESVFHTGLFIWEFLPSNVCFSMETSVTTMIKFCG